jgi:hypothetical protein
VVRSLVRKHQIQLVCKRLATKPRYQPGDLVLLRNRVEFPPKSKLHRLSLGPYRVLQHDKNDILVESLVDKRQLSLFVSDLLPYLALTTKPSAWPDETMTKKSSLLLSRTAGSPGSAVPWTSRFTSATAQSYGCPGRVTSRRPLRTKCT